MNFTSAQLRFLQNRRFSVLAICLLTLSFANVALSQGTTACPCAGVTNTVVSGSAGSQGNTGAVDWTSVTGSGASYSLNGVFSISMENLSFTIPATSIPAGTRFCSIVAPDPQLNGNANVGLIGYNTSVTGSYLTGYTVTITNISFTGVNVLGGTATLTASGISYTLVTQTGCVLPVELNSFTGKQEGRCASLEWQTNSEKDNDYFTVQKMVDGVFIDIAEIKSLHGTTQEASDYAFTDCDVDAMNYYRLFQTDDNGDKEYLGEMISVGIDRSEPGKLNVVPNPATNVACIYTDEDLKMIRVFSSDGRILFEKAFTEEDQQYCLNTEDFPSGVYMVNVQTEGGARSSQLVKQ